ISIIRAAAPPSRTYWCELRMPRLPEVAKSPQTLSRATFWPGVGYSVLTFDQSHSSSSATSCARPVSVPWPISWRATRITTLSSGLITTQALTSGVSVSARAALPKGRRMPRVKLPAAAEPTRKPRREIEKCLVIGASSLRELGGALDARADAVVGAAAADVVHLRIDVLVRRVRRMGEQGGGGHDLAGLAEAALRNVELFPGLLDRMRAIVRKSLDGHDLLILSDVLDLHRARAQGDTVDMHGAGAAGRDSATILGAGQLELFAQNPQKRGFRFNFHLVDSSVHVDLHVLGPPGLCMAECRSGRDPRRGLL